jgi:hypothetical protein
MTSLAVAVEKREWRLVSLYLLLGVSEAAALLPPETLTELIDLLGGEPETKAPGRGTRRG